MLIYLQLFDTKQNTDSFARTDNVKMMQSVAVVVGSYNSCNN